MSAEANGLDVNPPRSAYRGHVAPTAEKVVLLTAR
jgi:hypothetical protein